MYVREMECGGVEGRLIERARVVSGVLKDVQDGTLRLIHDTS